MSERNEDQQQALNPHRDQDVRRVGDHAADLLEERGVGLTGDESAEELAELLSAVDRFDARRRAQGADTFTNTPESSNPDDPEMVIPERRADESVQEYIRRIDQAAT